MTLIIPTLRTREPSTAVNFSLFLGLKAGRVNILNCSSEHISNECGPAISAGFSLSASTSVEVGKGIPFLSNMNIDMTGAWCLSLISLPISAAIGKSVRSSCSGIVIEYT